MTFIKPPRLSVEQEQLNKQPLNQLSVVDIREALDNCENLDPVFLSYICAEMLRRLMAKEMHL